MVVKMHESSWFWHLLLPFDGSRRF
jgi:hypothetical protein